MMQHGDRLEATAGSAHRLSIEWTIFVTGQHWPPPGPHINRRKRKKPSINPIATSIKPIAHMNEYGVSARGRTLRFIPYTPVMTASGSMIVEITVSILMDSLVRCDTSASLV